MDKSPSMGGSIRFPGKTGLYFGSSFPDKRNLSDFPEKWLN